ncbi:GNAT family N-acetyltransferase [Agrobacterium rhizogenes]|jgi:GNAT superfamily N-acetyltransferase|uniref:GNAT family N-acetyltransferase n=1 Tax=Rhizobium rhizogenes TaxID=359 RepID=UPI00157370A9|nr:GNAT family N-acetyltransferase [Rhizobium rhizogenes]NTF52931.1 GNAT family N-acetyltransferase [Rhizobium rhizogenes]NTH10141.1 GNAT family N-acetyltransferase [Rhizobium rhizogenes]NTH42693.1 GNAT family N-acetyltransferase [Rhizobium rhizogenes]NTI06700.1 GNAT family N-acetyltransferase [Rhizobium rhizogenes]NTI13505.1 GNAT family N-acetyltransferase [Rhizobium rhizogenes]
MTDIIVRSSLLDPAAQPLIDGLVSEYDGRYGAASRPGGARTEIMRYPMALFSPPLGDFLLLQRDDRTVAGGAFMSHDDETAELKRIWTDPNLRRQGLARQIVLALEDSAAQLGYTRTYLSTGFRQPEAVALYISLGYRPLFDTAADPTFYRSLPFEKHIGEKAGQTGTTPIYPPAASFEEATARVTALKAGQEQKITARLEARQTSAA